MTIKIRVTHWHDSDGFSRDEGWTAKWTDDAKQEAGRGDGRTYEEALSRALADCGAGEFEITRLRDTYESY